MHFNLQTESNRKKRGLDFITGCKYTIESFGLQKKGIGFFIYSIIICYDW